MGRLTFVKKPNGYTYVPLIFYFAYIFLIMLVFVDSTITMSHFWISEFFRLPFINNVHNVISKFRP